MNGDDDYYDGDMSDREYYERIQREKARDAYYDNVRLRQRAAKSADSGSYRFSSDGDDVDLSY